MYKLFISLLLLNTLLFMQPVGFAQTPGRTTPDKILKRATNVLGGEKILRNLSSQQSEGTITRLDDGAGGSFLLQTSRPNLFLRTFDINGFETATGYNGKSGWMRDSQNGLQTLTGEASKNIQFLANYQNNLWLNYKKDKSKVAFSGQLAVNGVLSDIVSLTTVKGVSAKIYFDKTSGLPVREEFPQMNLTNDYSDYRNIGGILEPFLISSTIDGKKYEIRLNSVIHNLSIAKNAFDFPNFSGEPLPDIPSLLKELQANEDRVENILDNYTYTQTNTTRELGKDGVLRAAESETYQLSFYKGYRIRRLVAKNGEPLSPEEQTKEDKQAQKSVAEIEKEVAKKEARLAKQSAAGAPADDNQRPSIAEVLRASNLLNPRRERFRGRDVIVFDFEPNPNFDYKNAKSFLKFFGKTAGVMWIDAEDKQVARLEAVLADNFKIGGGLLANLQKGAYFTVENERINNEIWLPRSMEINLSAKVLLLKSISVNQLINYGDYQKFNSEVKDSRIDEINKP